MKCFRKSSSVDQFWVPVRSSVKYISRGGTKVWGSLTGKHKAVPAVLHGRSLQHTKPLTRSLTDLSKDTQKSNSHSTSIHSEISVTKSTDQKHYTCLSPAELLKITKADELKKKSVPRKPPRKHKVEAKTIQTSAPSYEEFKKMSECSTPTTPRKIHCSPPIHTNRQIIEEDVVDNSAVDKSNEHSGLASALLPDGSPTCRIRLEKLEKLHASFHEMSPTSIIAVSSNFIDIERKDKGRRESIAEMDEKYPTVHNDVGAEDESSKFKGFIAEFKAAQAKPMFDRTSLKDVYELMDNSGPSFKENNSREKLIKDKFIVNLYGNSKATSPLSTPICKSRSRESSRNSISLSPLVLDGSSNSSVFFDEKAPLTPPATCGPLEQLDISRISGFNADDSIVIDDSTCATAENESQENDMKIYDTFREKRNKECSVIRGISRILHTLRSSNKPSMTSALLEAEKLLLLSTARCKLYTDNMLNYKNHRDPNTTGTVTISKITIPLKSGILQYYNDTYYVCLVRSNLFVYATKCVQPQGLEGRKYLTFDDDLTFLGLERNFKIYVKVFSIQMNNCKDNMGFRKVLPKKSVAYPVQVYYYDNLLTTESEESFFLLPAFKQCAIFELSMENIHTNKVYNFYPDSPLYKTASIKKTLSQLKMNVEMTGLLNFGQRPSDDEIIIWNVKYVVLEESQLRIYDNTFDEKPLVKIDLRNVASNLLTHSCHLKYCFQLDIVYDEDPDFNYSFKFPYFLRANTCSDFRQWTDKLNYVINVLKQWNMLPYLDKEILY